MPACGSTRPPRADGAAVARVNVTLSQPGRPRVRSSRNLIIVEADRADVEMTAAGAISAAGPAAVIRDVKFAHDGRTTSVTLVGTGRLDPLSVRLAPDGRRRLLLEFANVSSAVPQTATPGQGPVSQVRIGLSARSPLVTEVALELARPVNHAVEASADGQNLTVRFDDPQAVVAAAPPVPDVPARPPAPPRTPRLPPPRPRRDGSPAAQPAPAAAQQAPAAAAPVEPNSQAGTRDSQSQAQAKQYTGHPISLDFQGADLRSVLRTFSEISGLNLVIDPSIQGQVDVALRDVPWDQALDIILRANRLGYIVDGTIVRVAPLTVLAEEEGQKRKLRDEQALAGDLRVMSKSLSYAKAEDLKALLTATALSQRGSIQTDPRTNTIIINDLADRLERAA